MAENLFIKTHIYSNPKSREGWDKTFTRLNMLEEFHKEQIRGVTSERQKEMERRIFLGR